MDSLVTKKCDYHSADDTEFSLEDVPGAVAAFGGSMITKAWNWPCTGTEGRCQYPGRRGVPDF
jgi:hypothetical protein